MDFDYQGNLNKSTPNGQRAEPVEPELLASINRPWLTVRKISRVRGKEPLVAFADVAVGEFIIYGFPIFHLKHMNPSTGFPAAKGTDGVRYPTVECTHPVLARRIKQLILDEWRRLNEQRRHS